MSRSALSRDHQYQQHHHQQQQTQQQQQQLQLQQQQLQLQQQQQYQQYYAAMYATTPGMVPYAAGAYGLMPGMMPGVMPGMMPGMMPGVMPGVMPVPGVLPPGATYGPDGSIIYAPLQGEDDDYEDPETHNKNAIPFTGSSSNYNMNTLLFNNIMESDYFKALYQLRTYHEVIQEINACAKHVEPWQTGTARIPSTAFCLLLKLMLMKMTYKQMNGLLGKTGQPLVRAIGFLYLRYACYNDLWKWYEPYLEDEEEICPSPNPDVRMTIGSFVRKLLTDMNYFGTTLPRIPVPIERKIKVMLLLVDNKKKRRKTNLKLVEKGLFTVGAKVRAIYGDAENEPAWYDAIIDSIVPPEEGEEYNKYNVTFPEYGNSECVDLGDMELPKDASAGKEKERDDDEEDRKEKRGGGSRRSGSRDRRHERSRSRDRHRRDGGDRDSHRDRDRDRHNRRRCDSRSRSRSPSRSSQASSNNADNLMQAVLQSSRDASAAVGKNYASRPASYKGSLALKQDRYTVRKRSKSRSPDRSFGRRDNRDNRDNRDRDRDRDRDARPEAESSSSSSSTKVMSSAQLREQQERLKRLKETYGDASAK
jgi:pre-mRNA-splicing factor 38B